MIYPGHPSMKIPKHDERLKGPRGTNARGIGFVVHCTVSNPIPNSPQDRYGVIDYLANSRGLSVPWVLDDEAATIMVPVGYLGYGHAACLTGKASGVEIIGQASWSRKDWMKHENSVRGAAQIAAWYVAEVLELPLTIKNRKRFVVGHAEDHKLGGCSDHWDPGPNFPWDIFDEEFLTQSRVKGYRVQAEKGDEEKIRTYQVKSSVRAKQFARKWTKRGWKIARRQVWLKADFDEWD